MATYCAIAQAQRKERRSGSRSNLQNAMFQNALLTVAAHREEVLGRPPTSTSSYALTYGAAETSSSSQLSSSGSASGRSLSSGHKDTLKEAIRPVMKASSKHSFSQNLVEQAVSVTSTEFAVLKDLEAVGVEESIRNWAADEVESEQRSFSASSARG